MSLLTEQEAGEIWRLPENYGKPLMFARAIEAKVIAKIKAQGAVLRQITTQDHLTGEVSFVKELLYRLPEGD